MTSLDILQKTHINAELKFYENKQYIKDVYFIVIYKFIKMSVLRYKLDVKKRII